MAISIVHQERLSLDKETRQFVSRPSSLASGRTQLGRHLFKYCGNIVLDDSLWSNTFMKVMMFIPKAFLTAFIVHDSDKLY